MRRELTAEIDLNAALHNLNAVKKVAGGLPVIAVVKADAYGHGAVELSILYENAGVGMLAVAFTEEAVELREAGIKAPILVLFDNSSYKKHFELDLIPVIHDMDSARALSREARRRGTTIDVHLKVDTGMGRVGLDADVAIQAAELENLKTAGLMSHLSEADLTDMDFVRLQLERFNAVRSSFEKAGFKPLCHIANSAATCAYPESHLDAVRPGLVLYGISPYADKKRPAPPIRPLMSVSARILSIRRFPAGQPVSYGRTFITPRPTRAAVMAAGYADGYDRLYSNAADVLVRGKRAPVIGRVCMDLTLVDVTDIPDASTDDRATLLGQDGEERITASELAELASTIPYETLLSFGTRSRREYTNKPAALETAKA